MKSTFGVQRPHVASLIGVVWSHLDLVFQCRVHILLKEHLIHRHVKGWDDFLWILNELSVQVSVKRLQMLTIEVQERLADEIDLEYSI